MQAFALNDRRPRLTTTTIVSRRSLRQSPQTFHTRTGAKFHSKSHGRVWSDNHRKKLHTRTGAKFHSKRHGRVSSDNHRKSITPELVQKFTAKAMVVWGQTITAKVSQQNWCKDSQQKPWSYVLRQWLSWSALVVCHSEQMLATNLFSEKSTLRACPVADKFRIFLQLRKRKPTFVSCQFLFVSLHPN